jgi:hypothetical protein
VATTKEDIVQNIGVCSARSVFTDDGTPLPNETFNDYLTCEIDKMLMDFVSGNIFAVSSTNSLVRKHLLSLLSRQQQRALVYATTGEFEQIRSQVSEKLAKYIESALLFDVFNDFHQNHMNMAQIARTKINGMEQELKQFDSAVLAFNIELLGLRKDKEEAFDDLSRITVWNDLVARYAKDMSEELASIMSGR